MKHKDERTGEGYIGDAGEAVRHGHQPLRNTGKTRGLVRNRTVLTLMRWKSVILDVTLNLWRYGECARVSSECIFDLRCYSGRCEDGHSATRSAAGRIYSSPTANPVLTSE